MAEARRFRYDEPGSGAAIASALTAILAARRHADDEAIVFLCIGTDRSTGDSLGPLVGQQLGDCGLNVYGTLDQPVHASNLTEVLRRIHAEQPRAFVVAVDACLGRIETVGTISVGTGPLLPGAGVNKSLPEVGQAFITGTVNVGGFMEYFVLQNTRLSLVFRMADVIVEALRAATAAALRPGDTRHLAPASG